MPSFIPSFRIASANPEPQGCSTCYWHRDEYCGQITSEDLVLIMNSWGQWNRSLPWCSPLQSLIDGSCQGCRLITAHGRSREQRHQHQLLALHDSSKSSELWWSCVCAGGGSAHELPINSYIWLCFEIDSPETENLNAHTQKVETC